MKKVFSISMTFALLVAGIVMSGCNKNDQNNPDEPKKVQTYKMTITASKGADNSDPANGPKKILGLDPSGETLTAAWQAGDVISVFNVTQMEDLGSLTAETGGVSVQFSGDLTGPVEAGDELELFYLNPNYVYQAGTLDYISQNCDHAKGNVTVASVEGNSIYTENDAVFVNQQAIVKFTLIDKTTGTTINPDFFDFSLSYPFGPMPQASVLVSDAYSINGDGVLYVAIPGFVSQTISMRAFIGTDDPYTFEKADVTFANGNYYTITVEMTPPAPPAPPTPPTPGLIIGQFEVAPGKYVNFSQGNLQYDFDNSRWQFAENQWDYIGLANGTNISFQSGVIDLFGWGTGNAPAKYATDADYSTYSEWGNNAIDNGGNTADFGWRTLTDAEWEYLLNNHDIYPTMFTTSSYIPIFGYTLVPVLCDVTIPAFGGIFYAGQENWLNIYAPKGLVFLPAAGQRDVTSVTLEQNWKHIGQYWTSTNSSNEIPERGFEVDDDGGNTTSGSAARHLGNSVRLVIDVE